MRLLLVEDLIEHYVESEGNADSDIQSELELLGSPSSEDDHMGPDSSSQALEGVQKMVAVPSVERRSGIANWRSALSIAIITLPKKQTSKLFLAECTFYFFDNFS